MEYKKDYFGYVYEWTNITNGMKYIGSHYGSVEDYYAGSGKDFMKEYKIGMTLNIGLAGPMEKGDLDAANAFVDDVAKEYPATWVHEVLRCRS
jgi:hypothetical protein